VVNVSSEGQTEFTIKTKDKNTLKVNRNFLLRNYYNFLFYNIENKKPTSGSPDLNGEYLKISNLVKPPVSLNQELADAETKEKYLKLLKETFDELMTDASVSKKQIKPRNIGEDTTAKGGMPSIFVTLIQDEPLNKLLDDAFITKIQPIQREMQRDITQEGEGKDRKIVVSEEQPMGATPKEKEILSELSKGLGSDNEIFEYFKSATKAYFDGSELLSIVFDEALLDVKEKKLKELVGIRDTTGSATAKGTGVKTAYGSISKKKTKKETFGLMEEDDLDTQNVEQIKMNTDYGLIESIQEALAYFNGGAFKGNMEETFLEPLHKKIEEKKKKKKEKETQKASEKEITEINNKYPEQTYDSWARENSDKINEFIKASQSVVVTTMIRKLGFSVAKLKTKREEKIKEIDNNKDKSKEEKLQEEYLKINSQIDKVKPLRQLKLMTSLESTEIIDSFYQDMLEEYTEQKVIRDVEYIRADGKKGTLGTLFDDATKEGNTVDDNTLKELLHWLDIKLQNPINDLTQINKITFNVARSKWEVMNYRKFNQGMKALLRTGRSRSKKVSSDEDNPRVPVNLLGKFNTMINKFRKNVRVIKRALR
tara:strand:+ start:3681 stop:5468 length:1788 start_codon:yes stop_codon:yes gene_type:complete